MRQRCLSAVAIGTPRHCIASSGDMMSWPWKPSQWVGPVGSAGTPHAQRRHQVSPHSTYIGNGLCSQCHGCSEIPRLIICPDTPEMPCKRDAYGHSDTPMQAFEFIPRISYARPWHCHYTECLGWDDLYALMACARVVSAHARVAAAEKVWGRCVHKSHVHKQSRPGIKSALRIVYYRASC